MACTQEQIKNFPWTVKRAAALFKEARTEFVEKGVTDFNDIVDGLAANHGMDRELIIKGLSSPRGVGASLTDRMWAMQQQVRRIESAAKAAVQEWDKSKFIKGLNWVAEAPRRGLLAYHFGAFTKSHLSDQLFYNPKVYKDNFTQSWKLATERGIAEHERRVRTALNPANKNVSTALRAGLNIGEGGVGRFTKETREMTGVGKIFGGPDRAAMAYDELRMSRLKIWDKEFARLSPAEQADKEQLKDLASVINHDSGTTARSNRFARFILLSPRLFPAQLAHVYSDIPRALYHTGMGLRYAEAAPAMRYVARKTAILAGAYGATIAANTGFGLAYKEATGSDAFMPNLGQEGLGRASFLRPKVFGYSVPVSPTVELAKLPLEMVVAGAKARTGENRMVEATRPLVQTALGRQNPLFSLAEQILFGQEVGSGRPTPRYFPTVISPPKETPAHPRLAWNELLAERLPIPAGNYVREYYDELRHGEGMPADTALSWIKTLGIPTIEAATAYHFSPDYPSGAGGPAAPAAGQRPSLQQQREQRPLLRTKRADLRARTY